MSTAAISIYVNIRSFLPFVTRHLTLDTNICGKCSQKAFHTTQMSGLRSRFYSKDPEFSNFDSDASYSEVFPEFSQPLEANSKTIL
jgi:hypothetical protein